MVEREEQQRDLASLVVASVGSVVETGEIWEPWRLLDPMGVRVEPVAAFLADLQAMGRPATTQRSYSLALLRWFRFLWAVEVGWDRVSRAEARDFCRWMQVTDKPVGVHWRHRGPGPPPAMPAAPVRKRSAAPNLVTGKATTGPKYAPATSLHAETVLRGFYGFHRDMGSGPVLNPFPLARDRSVGRAHAHHNPLEPFRNERAGLYRPKVTSRVPRHIPDERFNELFAGLGSHRDRALVAFYVSTGARASELLGATGGDVDPGQRGPQGKPGVAAAAGVTGLVRVVAALPSPASRSGASGSGPGAVVDLAAPVPSSHLSRRSSHVRTGERRLGDELDLA
jgi:hypothetical protein